MRAPSALLCLSNQQQAAASSIMECHNPWQTINVVRCGKLQRSGDSSVVGSNGQLPRNGYSNVERCLLKGKRDRELGCVSPSEQERFLSERQNLHNYFQREAQRALQGECVAQRRLSEAEVEMDRKNGRGEILANEAVMQTNGPVKLKWKTEEHLKN